MFGRGRFIGRPTVSACASPKISKKDPVALSERMIWHIVTKYARQTGLANKLAPHEYEEDLREIMPGIRRGLQADPIAALPRIHPNYRAIFGIAAEPQGSGE